MSASLLMLVSCMQQELFEQAPEGSAFYAQLEQFSGSKTSLDSYGSVLWCASDRIAVYNSVSDAVDCYEIDKAYVGCDNGAFVPVGTSEPAHAQGGYNVALYPYSDDISVSLAITKSDSDQTAYIIKGLTIPQTQYYAENSFGLGTFPMVAVSETNYLSFRNVFGGMKLQLLGDRSIRKIIVTGKNGEALSGVANIKAYADGSAPEVQLMGKVSDTVVLDCGENGVALNVDTPTNFIISLPPMEFSQGFIVTIIDMEGNEKVLSGAVNTVYRSTLLKMPKVTVGKVVQDDPDQMLSVSELMYDGYKMSIKVPDSVRESNPGEPGSRAIRYTQADLMTYNYFKNNHGDDYTSLLYNASKYVTEDTIVEYSDRLNWGQDGSDVNGDGVIDENDVTYLWNPISPGEPVVFLAGEFEWMTESDETGGRYGFHYPYGWDPGYYLPCLDGEKFWTAASYEERDAAWTGAFERKIFRILEPGKLDGKVNMYVSDLSPVNATITLFPDEDVYGYSLIVAEESMYREILNLCEGNEDYLQWAVSSYFAAINFGARYFKGPAEVKLSHIYYQDYMPGDTDYYVLITAMGDEVGRSQSFAIYRFSTPPKSLPAPEIVVTPVDTGDPYLATFNIKCTSYATNPLATACYAANYVSEWARAANSSSDYFNVTRENNPFSSDELRMINSGVGLYISVPTVDGQTTRCVVVGYNEEYTPNNMAYEDILMCPAVADYVAPYDDPSEWMDPSIYEDLVGDWTARADAWSADGSRRYKTVSKMSLLSTLVGYGYDDALPRDVYDLYYGYKLTKEEIDGFWAEFKGMATTFTRKRLENKNRLLGLGWPNNDPYGRLDVKTPYDLFCSLEYNTYDMVSLYYDFGPKWFIETELVNGVPEYFIPVDSRTLPVAANWTGQPFYLGGMAKYVDGSYVTWSGFTYVDGLDARFPVTVSSDRNTITIHPFVYEGVEYYPQMIGNEDGSGMFVDYPVVSEIVLTRGWDGENGTKSVPVTRSAPMVKSAASASASYINGSCPKVVYKKRTVLKEEVEFEKIEMSPLTLDQFKQRADEWINEYMNR